ncbi:cytochrome c oxidase assembly factor 1 family protein [Synechococcus sp. Nb3U1]|uniref:cytochrome c oxidase assembly factor Coa1 family protein n=1 Tax=Synechococcus sp. Nb3U1 TaxID=1914529 RepID=UPI001F2932D7|nr:cytochrome c oxidase assembly factor Coa1 family protein [Synechococcus sp. Nb3U1]MCF2970405.1 cytochrome c oxidase assembly factor 1 family protein [Synechococcus sp. Nb3U1]
MSESPQKVGCATPLGCCGCGCLGALAVLSLGLAGVGFLVWTGIRASGAFRSYHLAVEVLEHNPVVVERLGDPLRPGWLSQLRFQENEEAGWVCLSFLITGAQRTGDVTVESERGAAGSEWYLRDVQVKVDGDPNPIQVIGSEERGSRCRQAEPDSEWQPEADI